MFSSCFLFCWFGFFSLYQDEKYIFKEFPSFGVYFFVWWTTKWISLKGESGEKRDSKILLLALTKVGRNLFLICRLHKKPRGHKTQVNVGMSEKPALEDYHLLCLTSHIGLRRLVQLCELIRIVFHPVPKCLQIMQNIFTFQSLKRCFSNYVFKWREILLLLLITRHFLQNTHALKGWANTYFIVNYWIATTPQLDKVCK